MKKLNLLLILVLAVAIHSYGQYFTVKLGGGYSWPGLQNSTTVLTFQPGADPDPAKATIIPLVALNTTITDSAKNRYQKNVYGTYGQGGHIDFSFGYMINPYFGVEIDGAYLWGSTISASQTVDLGTLLGSNATIVTRTHSNGLSLNPSLYFRGAKPGAKVAPFARLGIALPVFGALYHSLDIDLPNTLLDPNGAKAHIEVKTESTVSLGFQGGVGVEYTPIPLITVYGEVNAQYLMARAKQSDLTAYTLALGHNAATNTLSGYTTYSKVTNFVDNLTYANNTTDLGKQRDASGGHNSDPNYVNEDKGHDVLRQVANITNFGFTIGVRFNMSKKIFTDPFGKKAKAAASAK